MSPFGKLFRAAAAAALTTTTAAPAVAESPDSPAATPPGLTGLVPAAADGGRWYYGSGCVLPPNCPPTPFVLPGMPPQPGTVPPAPQPGQATPPAAGAAPSAALPFESVEGGIGTGPTVSVFGDLLGGSAFAGPLPVRVAPSGQLIGPVPVVVLPNGQRVALGVTPQTPTDELLGGRAPLAPANTPGAVVRGVLPPPGTVFDQSLADLVSRVPAVYRGAFKVTENESPRPRTRAYVSYYYYDQVARNFGGPDVPRIMVHQQVFGYEQAFLDSRYSVGIRLPYNQIVSPGFFNQTALGDLTLVTKGVIAENREAGNLLSGGVAVTAPTGAVPFASTTTGVRLHSTLVQPYLGYILTPGDVFVQGFTSLIVPTASNDVTLLANDVAVGYRAYQGAQGSVVSAVIPVFEAHLNTPLNHRGTRTEPAGYVDQLTLLGGVHGVLWNRTILGTAVGAPVTGPRPFSLQATVQLNHIF